MGKKSTYKAPKKAPRNVKNKIATGTKTPCKPTNTALICSANELHPHTKIWPKNQISHLYDGTDGLVEFISNHEIVNCALHKEGK